MIFFLTSFSPWPALEACDDMTKPARPLPAQVAPEVGDPEIVTIADLLLLVHTRQAEGQARVALDALGVHQVQSQRPPEGA